MEKLFRHGDMFFIKKEKVDLSKLKKVETDQVTVGLGEVNGHAHAVDVIDDASIIAYVDNSFVDNGKMDMSSIKNAYFGVNNGPAVVTHEEHGPIIMDEGLYVRVNQMEYNPFTEALDVVRD